MKTVYAYQCSDDALFTSERDAKAHQTDIVGEMLDGLLPHDDRGNVTMSDRHNMLMKMLDDTDLARKINELGQALNHQGDETQ